MWVPIPVTKRTCVLCTCSMPIDSESVRNYSEFDRRTFIDEIFNIMAYPLTLRTIQILRKPTLRLSLRRRLVRSFCLCYDDCLWLLSYHYILWWRISLLDCLAIWRRLLLLMWHVIYHLLRHIGLDWSSWLSTTFYLIRCHVAYALTILKSQLLSCWTHNVQHKKWEFKLVGDSPFGMTWTSGLPIIPTWYHHTSLHCLIPNTFNGDTGNLIAPAAPSPTDNSDI